MLSPGATDGSAEDDGWPRRMDGVELVASIESPRRSIPLRVAPTNPRFSPQGNKPVQCSPIETKGLGAPPTSANLELVPLDLGRGAVPGLGPLAGLGGFPRRAFVRLEPDTDIGALPPVYPPSPVHIVGAAEGTVGGGGRGGGTGAIGGGFPDRNVAMLPRASNPWTYGARYDAWCHGRGMGCLWTSDSPGQPAEPQSTRLLSEDVPLGSSDAADFIAPAETMKKIFRIPYTNARVSLVLHRVGDSLILDGALDEASGDASAGWPAMPRTQPRNMPHSEDGFGGVDRAAEMVPSDDGLDDRAAGTAGFQGVTVGGGGGGNGGDTETKTQPPHGQRRTTSSTTRGGRRSGGGGARRSKPSRTSDASAELLAKFLYYSVSPSDPSRVMDPLQEGSLQLDSVRTPKRRPRPVRTGDELCSSCGAGSDVCSSCVSCVSCASACESSCDVCASSDAWLPGTEADKAQSNQQREAHFGTNALSPGPAVDRRVVGSERSRSPHRRQHQGGGSGPSGEGSSDGGDAEDPDSDILPALPPDFRRVVRWRFADMDMLLGSDVLVFSDEDHPSFTVHLQDAKKRFTSIACLDFWLENVLANVPETAICYHKEGHVQGYQLVRTEDIPALCGSGQGGGDEASSDTGADPTPQQSYSAIDLRDAESNAASLLEFLKRSCVDENATYCLTREDGDNTLRLFKISGASVGASDDVDGYGSGGSGVASQAGDRENQHATHTPRSGLDSRATASNISSDMNSAPQRSPSTVNVAAAATPTAVDEDEEESGDKKETTGCGAGSIGDARKVESDMLPQHRTFLPPVATLCFRIAERLYRSVSHDLVRARRLYRKCLHCLGGKMGPLDFGDKRQLLHLWLLANIRVADTYASEASSSTFARVGAEWDLAGLPHPATSTVDTRRSETNSTRDAAMVEHRWSARCSGAHASSAPPAHGTARGSETEARIISVVAVHCRALWHISNAMHQLSLARSMTAKAAHQQRTPVFSNNDEDTDDGSKLRAFERRLIVMATASFVVLARCGLWSDDVGLTLYACKIAARLLSSLSSLASSASSDEENEDDLSSYTATGDPMTLRAAVLSLAAAGHWRLARVPESAPETKVCGEDVATFVERLQKQYEGHDRTLWSDVGDWEWLQDIALPSWMPTVESWRITLDKESNFNRVVQYCMRALGSHVVTDPRPFNDRDAEETRGLTPGRPKASPDGRTSRLLDECILAAMASAYDDLGDLFLGSGRFTKAAQHFKQGIQLFEGLRAGQDAARRGGAKSTGAHNYNLVVAFSLARLQLKMATTCLRSRQLDATSKAIRLLDSSREVIAPFTGTKCSYRHPHNSAARIVAEIRRRRPDLVPNASGTSIGATFAFDVVCDNDLRDVTSVVAYGRAVMVQTQIRRAEEAAFTDAKSIVAEALQSALQVCDDCGWTVEAAGVHYRLAMFHANSVAAGSKATSSKEAARRKRQAMLALKHFNAVLQEGLPSTSYPLEHTLIHLDIVDMLCNVNMPGRRSRNLATALNHVFDTGDAFSRGHVGGVLLSETKHSDGGERQRDGEGDHEQRLWEHVEKTLHTILRESITSHGTEDAGMPARADVFRELYLHALTQRRNMSPSMLLGSLATMYAGGGGGKGGKGGDSS